jgi:hypothetical protein
MNPRGRSFVQSLKLRFLVSFGILALVSNACAGNGSKRAARPPSPRWSAAQDIVVLGRIWSGETSACGEDKVSRVAPSQLERECTVPGWSSVTLARQANDASARVLHAHADNMNTCVPSRFAEDMDVVRNMQSNIVSQSTFALRNGPFDGSCLSVEALWIDGTCSVSVVSTAAGPALEPFGCSR